MKVHIYHTYSIIKTGDYYLLGDNVLQWTDGRCLYKGSISKGPVKIGNSTIELINNKPYLVTPDETTAIR